MRVLLLSAYDAASHKYWRQLLCSAFNSFQWTVLTLPPRHFNWRVRGNSFSWAMSERQVLEQPYDLLVATSMVDLSALKGLVPALCSVPSLVYFHENQFAYPVTDRQYSTVEPQILNLYSALAADVIAFNSDYNRQTFLAGVKQLLANMPDKVPDGIIDKLSASSRVLPVPLVMDSPNPSARDAVKPLHIVWNHRWEYDKAPERLCQAINLLLHQDVNITLSIVGQQFRQTPAALVTLKEHLNLNHPSVLKHWGYIVCKDDYHQLLAQADVVVSTALHDFQGLSVIEAVAAGCLPLVPDRLCYSEWFGCDFRYPSFIESPAKEARALADQLIRRANEKQHKALPPAPDVTGLSIKKLLPVYLQAFNDTKQAWQDGQQGSQPVS